MKRLLSILTVFVILTAALAVTSAAQESDFAQTGEAVETVDCRVECPVAGTHPDRYASPDNDEAYTAEIVSWYLNESPYPDVGETDYFTAGKSYCVRIRYTPITGYYFDDNTKYFINGERARYVGARTYEITMTSYQREITSGFCTITNPAVSHFPDMDPQTDDERYTASIYYWAKNDGSGRILNANHRFEPLTMYKVAIFFTPKPGYYFADNAYYYVNGKSVELIYGLHSACVLEFPKLPNPKYKIYGDVTSYISETDPVTIRLTYDDINETFFAETKETGCNITYYLTDIPYGFYIIEFSKPHHVSRKYGTHIFDKDDKFDMILCPIGDVSGDGKVTSRDSSQAFQISQGKGNFDAYQKRCGDVAKNDGKVTSADASRIFQHSQGKINLWS